VRAGLAARRRELRRWQPPEPMRRALAAEELDCMDAEAERRGHSRSSDEQEVCWSPCTSLQSQGADFSQRRRFVGI